MRGSQSAPSSAPALQRDGVQRVDGAHPPLGRGRLRHALVRPAELLEHDHPARPEAALADDERELARARRARRRRPRSAGRAAAPGRSPPASVPTALISSTSASGQPSRAQASASADGCGCTCRRLGPEAARERRADAVQHRIAAREHAGPAPPVRCTARRRARRSATATAGAARARSGTSASWRGEPTIVSAASTAARAASPRPAQPSAPMPTTTSGGALTRAPARPRRGGSRSAGRPPSARAGSSPGRRPRRSPRCARCRARRASTRRASPPAGGSTCE